MARPCSICQHPKRSEIDAALAAGESFRNVMERHGGSVGALKRHKDTHLAQVMAKAVEVRAAVEVAQGSALLTKVAGLEADARRIATAAEEAKDFDTALKGIREILRICELLAKLQGELDESPKVAVALVQTPEWEVLRAKLLTALEPHPVALAAVIKALQETPHA